MDRGIWAVWYDLPEEGRSEYISWLHEEHLPSMLTRPGYLWAAHVENIPNEERLHNKLTRVDDPVVPTGKEYLLMFGAETAHTFFNPSPSELAEAWPKETKEMLGRRTNARTGIFVEVARGNGPEAAARAPGITPGPAIQIGSFNTDSLESEEALTSWFTQHRFADLEPMEGCISIRKMVSCYGWAKHAILYEFVSMEAVDTHFTPFLKNNPEKRDLMRAVTSHVIHAPASPTLGMRIWPPVEG